MILYGRNPVREALRGRRAQRVTELWATPGAAREPWLEGLAVHDRQRPRRSSARCGSARHQGICADAGAYPIRRRRPSCSRGAEPLIVALDQIQDPQNLGAIAAPPSAPAPPG